MMGEMVGWAEQAMKARCDAKWLPRVQDHEMFLNYLQKGVLTYSLT